MRVVVVPILLAVTWYVKPGGTGNGTQGNPYGTVQQGVNAAASGDTVQLAPGTYVENVSVSKDGVSLVAQTPGTAVINGQKGAAQQKPALSIKGGDWQIVGIVFVDGGSQNLLVQGASCPDPGGLLLRQVQTGGRVLPPAGSCTADAGDVHSYDVSVDCFRGEVVIESSQFLAAACTNNLLLTNVGPSALIQDNELSGARIQAMNLDMLDGGEIRRNFVHGPCCDGVSGTSQGQGFGIHAQSSRALFIHHNLVVDTGEYGIAAFDSKNKLANEQMNFSNNTVVGDECGVRFNAVSGTAHSNLVAGGVCGDGGCNNVCGVPCGVEVVNTEGGAAETVSVGFDLFNPSAAIGKPYCVQAGQTVTDAGPLSLASPQFVQAAAGNYRLSILSPAVDMGDPGAAAGLDLDGNPEPVAGRPADAVRVDIGCYELQPDGGTFAADGGADAGDSGHPATDGGADAGAGPVAVILPPLQSVDAGAAVQLDGTGSTASAGATLVSYQWTELQGPTGVHPTQGAQQSLALGVPGIYRFQLVVQDSAGLVSAPTDATVMVNGDESPPAYKTGCSCGTAGVPAAVAFLAIALAWLKGTRRVARSPGLARRP